MGRWYWHFKKIGFENALTLRLKQNKCQAVAYGAQSRHHHCIVENISSIFCTVVVVFLLLWCALPHQTPLSSSFHYHEYDYWYTYLFPFSQSNDLRKHKNCRTDFVPESGKTKVAHKRVFLIRKLYICICGLHNQHIYTRRRIWNQTSAK